MSFVKVAATALIIATGVVGMTGIAVAQSDVIKERKDGFQSNRKNLGAIKTVVDGNGPASGALAPAQEMAAFGAKLPSLFPQGSGTGDTKATPAIWSDWAGFQKAAKDFETAATAVASAASANNIDGVKAGFAQLGATCGACHDKYRAK